MKKLKSKIFVVLFFFSSTLLFEYCAVPKQCPAYGEGYNQPDISLGKVKRRQRKKERLF